MQEVVFPAREVPAGTSCALGWAVLALGLVFFAGEVVLVLFESVAGIQLAWTVLVIDCEVVADTEVDSGGSVAGRIFDGNLFCTDEMQFPSVAVPDGTRLLDVLDSHVRARLVLHEDEV